MILGEVKATVFCLRVPLASSPLHFLIFKIDHALVKEGHTPQVVTKTVIMPFPAGSYEDVRAWAEAEFPAYFAAVADSVDNNLFQTNKLDGEFVNGKVVLQPILIRMLGVALTASDGLPVHARFIGDNEVELVRHTEIKDPKDGNKVLWYIKPVTDVTEVELYEPFCHVIDTGHPAAVDRLETLIRFFYLKCGDKNAVQPRLGFFKTHFRAACRDVARATGSVYRVDETDNDTLPGECLMTWSLHDAYLTHWLCRRDAS